MIRLPEAGGVLPDRYDIFIAACGADVRAYEAMRQLNSLKLLTNVTLLDFEERRAGMNKDQERQYSQYKKHCAGAARLPCSIMNPGRSMKAFAKIIRRAGHPIKIGLDISTITEPFFFPILRGLQDLGATERLDVFYTESRSYVKKSPGGYGFTSGQLKAREIDGFPGELMFRNDKLLIVVLGFEGVASAFMRNDVSPKTTIPINGFPGILLHYKDESIVHNRELLDEYTQKEMRYAPAANPFETYDLLERICSQHSAYAITICPLGPKPMSLGCALFALDHNEVRISYPFPEKYSNQTTKEHGVTWMFPVGKL